MRGIRYCLARVHTATANSPILRPQSVSWRAVAAALITFAALAIPQARPEAVSATNWGSSSCGPDPYASYCVADDRYHYVYLAGVGRSDIRSDSAYILDRELDNRTDLIASVVTGSSYDVRAYQQSYGDTGYYGATYCPTGAAQGGSDPARWCRPQYVRFNTYYTFAFDTAEERRSIACHELGHTAGLRHYPEAPSDSCMYPTAYVSTLTLHDIVMINNHY